MPRRREESGRCSKLCVFIFIGVLAVIILLAVLTIILFGLNTTNSPFDHRALSYQDLQINIQVNESDKILHHSAQDERPTGNIWRDVLLVIGSLFGIIILCSFIFLWWWMQRQNGNDKSPELPRYTSADNLSSQRETLVKPKCFTEEEDESNLEENVEVCIKTLNKNKEVEFEKNKHPSETEKKCYEKPKVNIPNTSEATRQRISTGMQNMNTRKHTKGRKVGRNIPSKKEVSKWTDSSSSDSPTQSEHGGDKKQEGTLIHKRHAGIENRLDQSNAALTDTCLTNMIEIFKSAEHAWATKQTKEHRSSQKLNSMLEHSLEGPTQRIYSDSKKTQKQQSIRTLERKHIRTLERKQSEISRKQHAQTSSSSSLASLHPNHSTDIEDTGLKQSACNSLTLLREKASVGTSQRVKTDSKRTSQQQSIHPMEKNQYICQNQYAHTSTSSSFLSLASGNSKTSMIQQVVDMQDIGLKPVACDSSSEYDTGVSKFNSNNSSLAKFPRFKPLENDSRSLIIKLLKRIMSAGVIIEDEDEYIHFMYHTIEIIMDATKKTEEEVISITCEDFDKCKELNSERGYKIYIIDSESGFLSIGVEEWDCLKLYKQQRDYVCQRKMSEESEFAGSVYVFIDHSGKPLTNQKQIEDSKSAVEDIPVDSLNMKEHELKTCSDDHAEITALVYSLKWIYEG